MSAEFIRRQIASCVPCPASSEEPIASTGASFSRSNFAQVKRLEAKFEGWGCWFEPKIELFWRNEL
ncbi:MAG: hypothetical protein HZRFUVUK_001585, partial [Candidatus Fervidibacterota bacterium]